jgi:PAS domain S-box-containing protein
MNQLFVLKESSARGAREAQAERRFRELLQAAPDAIIEADGNGRIVLLNAMAEKMFGYSGKELLRKSVEALMRLEFRNRHVQHRSEFWRHPSARLMGTGLGLHAQRKDGSTFSVEIRLSPVVSKDGYCVTAIIRDVTAADLDCDHRIAGARGRNRGFNCSLFHASHLKHRRRGGVLVSPD